MLTTVTFAANDPFKFNQRSAPAGSITQILGAQMQVRLYAVSIGYPHPDFRD